MSRTRLATWNYFSAVLFTVATVIVGLVSTPLLLNWLGEERFGALRVITEWYGYLLLLELGIGGALSPLLAKAVAQADTQSVRRILAAGTRAYLPVSLGIVAVGLGLAVVVNWLIPVSGLYVADLQRAFVIGLLSMLLLPLAPFRALAEASQRGYWINGVLILQSLLITGMSLLLAWRGWGLTGQMIAVVTGGLVFSIVVCANELRTYPRLLWSAISRRSEPHIQRELWSLNRAAVVINICGRVSFLTDSIIVATILGPIAVVPLFVTRRLAGLAEGQLHGVGNASWAALAELYAQGQLQVFNHRVVELTSLVTTLGVASMIPITAYNHHFVARWVGASHYGGNLVTVVAALNALLVSLASFWGWCFFCTGQVRRIVPVTIAGAVINFITSLVLTKTLGVVGPLLGTLVAMLATNIWYLPNLLYRVFDTPRRELIRAVIAPLAWGIPYAGVVWWVANAHEPQGWLGLMAEMGAAGLLYLVMWWLFILSASKRTIWVERVQLSLRRSPAL